MRSFSSYANVAPTVPFSKSCNLCDLDGNSAGAGWLQLHDLAAASSLASGTTVPLASRRVAAAGPIPSMFETIGPITFKNGLCIALSSTQTVYTAVATAFDVFGDIETYELDETDVPGLSTTTVGDTSSNVTGLTVWADDATNQGLHSLREILVTNGSAAIRYLQLFTVSPSDGDIPLRTFTFALSQTRTLRFGGGDGVAGNGGFVPFRLSSAGAYQNGCYLAMSTTAATLTLVVATVHKMQAKYV